ncbi:hypothetical protein IW261DRAFT_1556115 [Armillaria novae-zelandiae]|uniref:Uncharacterized protein n=1 Tax=Armillaria novae-zelandiae TaxID=153914 RepID=A0AA39USG5_9AGAR|nr:hypothetical protein IW261DRAFT_1556115 [Armillaria novae-zelandiae]
MSYYYPTQPSYQPQPVVYTSSHRSHSYSPSAAYYPTTHPGTYGGNNVVYIPSHSSSSRHRHGTTIMPDTAGTQVITVPSSSRHGHRHHRRHHGSSHHHHSSRHLTIGERIARFFGFGRSRYKIKSRNSSWGFLGRSRRRRYVDARTGAEVDKKGRPVYRV